MTKTILESKRLLESASAWAELKEGLLDGLSGNKRANTEKLLENSRTGLVNLMENAVAGSTSAGNVGMLPKIILPVIRRVAPTVIANEIMGVQPMSGPLGYVYSMRYRYAETFGQPNSVNAGSEVFNPLDIARFYSGNGDSDNPAGANTSVLEGTGGRKLNLELVNKAIEAKTRKLNAVWTFEAQQDAQAQAGIDIEAELMSMLAQEITAEIDQEMLFRLRALPGAPATTFDQANVSGVATFVGDEHAALAILMLQQANLIAQRTRKGPANWAVVSPTSLTILQSATSSALARSTSGEFEAPTNVRYVGMLNDTMKLYVDSYAQQDTPVLLGYKGSDTDAAAFYCPYIPLMSTPVVIDPNTYQPSVSFMTRYAYTQFDNTADSLGNSADYVSTIAINTTNLRFQ
jgi:hypothetical protein